MKDNYLEINRKSWNTRTELHFDSAFYDNASFLEGKSSLKEIELSILGDVNGKKILHLQCHFGQDTLSLARMGAQVTGVDLSDRAIEKARELTLAAGLEAQFICSDIYELPVYLDQQFDLVFTTYGTIGWLPDLEKWGAVISHFLKPGGQLVFAEFHPVVWMFDDDFSSITYRYFKDEPIVEANSGSYAAPDAEVTIESISWNHGMAEVVTALLKNNMSLLQLKEYDYSPYNCFRGTEEIAPGKFIISSLGRKIPMVYAILAQKQGFPVPVD